MSVVEAGAPATIPPTARTTVKQRAARGVYDRAAIHAILDEGLVAHVGFAVDGQPFVMPTVYARIGDRLYLHGSTAARMLRALRAGMPACVTVTLLDGLVLARSWFRHSMNYRSVVVLGLAREVVDRGEKLAALEAFVDHVVPGRAAGVRAPSEEELQATMVLALPIDEASAKIRSGPPIDLESDLALPCWAGEVPLRISALPPVGDPQLPATTEAPPSVVRYERKGRT
ncbi:MAG: pyridoxamine 5'-phosphate oxidase family protein [Candidatus Binatia bacterium]